MFICYISVLHKFGKQRLDELLGPLGMDWRELVVLLVVEQVPGIVQSRLIPFLQTDKANVAKLLKEMEMKKLLERQEEAEDHRQKTCHLTLHSAELLPKLHSIMNDWESQCFEGLSESERLAFLKAARQIGYNLTGAWDL